MPQVSRLWAAGTSTHIFHRYAAGLTQVQVLQGWQLVQEGRLAHEPTPMQGQHLQYTPAMS
jgi:hypothetical protein